MRPDLGGTGSVGAAGRRHGEPVTSARDGDDRSETTPLLSPASTDNDNDNASNADSETDEFAGLPAWRRPSVAWLLAPFFLYTLAFGGALVPKLNLIVDLVCSQYFSERSLAPLADNAKCRASPEVQRSVASFTLVLNLTTGLLSAATAPKIGALSDRHGRKWMLVVSSLGGLIGEAVTVLAARFPNAVHYRWLVAGAVVEGLGGSFTAGSLLSSSYTSDCTSPSRRAVSIGYLQACLFSGLALGPLAASYLADATGSIIAIFYVVVVCHALFIVFLTLALPESLSKARQMTARARHAAEMRRRRDAAAAAAAAAAASTTSSSHSPAVRRLMIAAQSTRVAAADLLAPLHMLLPRGGPPAARLRVNLVSLAVVEMLLMGVVLGSSQVTLLYTEYMFDWGNRETSRYVSLISSMRVLFLAVVFPIVNYLIRKHRACRRRGCRRRAADTSSDAVASGPPVIALETNRGADAADLWVLRAALLTELAGAVGFVLVRSPRAFVASAMLAAAGSLASATLQGALTKHAPGDTVGRLLGALGLLNSLSRVLAPLLFNTVYVAAVAVFPQAHFVLMAGLLVMAVALATLIRPHVYYSGDVDGNTLVVDEASGRQSVLDVEPPTDGLRRRVTGSAGSAGSGGAADAAADAEVEAERLLAEESRVV